MRRLEFLCALTVVVAACSKPAPPAPRIYILGERVENGPMVYRVTEARWLRQLGEGPEARVPAHRFFAVRFSVVNGGAAEAYLPPFFVVDASGQAQGELADAGGLADWIGIVRKVNANDTLEGSVVFDVEPKAYHLRIGEDGEQPAPRVELPLRFEYETGPIPETPGQRMPGVQ